MGGAPGALDTLAFLVRVVLAVGSEVVVAMAVHLVPVSEDGLLHTLPLRRARDALALSLRLSHAKFLRNEAVFDHLVDVLFLGKWALVLEVHVAHLLTDVGLVDALRVMPDEAMIDQTLPNEVPIDAIGVRGSRSLLVTSRLDLVFAEENAFAMDLLEGNVRR